jgi:FkbM family methyltransferase
MDFPLFAERPFAGSDLPLEGPTRPIGERWRSAIGSARSLLIYYGNPMRQWRMDRLYSDFVREGDLVFDIGSHVGDRIGSFRRLGCRVVAVEPQPRLVRILRRFYGRDPHVAVEPMAIAAAPGTVELFVNISNASLSTASSSFVAAALEAPGWRDERWPGRLVVTAVTLDQLIERHGEPIFAKIDVEGFEAEALAGLSRPLAAFSFEFTTILRRVAIECITRCRALGEYRYNAALGETQRLVFPQWVDAEAIACWLEALPESANSGDVYARLRVLNNRLRNFAVVSQTGHDLPRRSSSALFTRRRKDSNRYPYLASHPDPRVRNSAKPGHAIYYGELGSTLS